MLYKSPEIVSSFAVPNVNIPVSTGSSAYTEKQTRQKRSV